MAQVRVDKAASAAANAEKVDLEVPVASEEAKADLEDLGDLGDLAVKMDVRWTRS